MNGWIIALIAVSGSCAYLTVARAVARWMYGRIRPSRVPLCGKPADAVHPDNDGFRATIRLYDTPGHKQACYVQKSGWAASSSGGAIGQAAIGGMIWPLALLILTVCATITRRQPPTLAERDATDLRELR